MLGYFDDKNREYVITDMFPRRCLLNYLWNDTSVCAADQFGFGTSWSVIDGKKRPIEFGQREFVIRNGERLIYIKDRETGEFYSPNRNYNKLPFDKHECHVGLGYQKVVSEYKKIKTEFTILTPKKDNLVLFNVKVENVGEQTKDLDLYFYNMPKLDPRADTASSTFADYDKNLGGIYYSTDGYNSKIEIKKSYLASSEPIDGYAVTDTDFKGLYGSYENPEGVKAEKLISAGSTFQEVYAGAFQYSIKLKPNECFETVIACGVACSYDDCVSYSKKYANKSTFLSELSYQREKNEESLGVFEVNTPDEYVNSMVNVWLKRQLSLGKSWGRLYGKGFRDMMQDTSAFVSLDLQMARVRIVDILRHQYEDGTPIRMYEPDLRKAYNDSAMWIPATILAYLNESGDLTVLDEEIPFIKGTSVEKCDGAIGFFPYVGTEEKYSVFEHLYRAMESLYHYRGKRGLVLFRNGDWNDSMNAVGLEGRGESVWLTIATIKAYNEFIEILKLYDKVELISEYTKRITELKESVSRYGWDNDHLLYGYNDYDEKIGAEDDKEVQIFLNPQTWAVLANLTDEKTLNQLMDVVEKRLSCDYGYMQCSLGYEKGNDRIGSMSYQQRGMSENGSVYNHGVAFKMVADCLLNRGDKAYETFKKISYDNPLNPNNGAEPYAVSNMYAGPKSKYLKGYAPMAWVTGTAGWIYKALTEYVCGIRPVFDGLMIKPCFPNIWNNVKVKRIFRNKIFNIEYLKSDQDKIIINQQEIKGNVINLRDTKEINEVTVFYN